MYPRNTKVVTTGLRDSGSMEQHRMCTKNNELPELRSAFLVVLVTEEAVWIVDQSSAQPPKKSVTNDAENVVAHLEHHYPRRRIYYRDTDNNWDELTHEAGIFKGFKQARDKAPKKELLS